MDGIYQVIYDVFGFDQFRCMREYIVPETHNQILIKTRGV